MAIKNSLFPFQERSVEELMGHKHFIISSTGSGKSAMAVVFAEKKCREAHKNKVIVVTTASKCKTKTADGLNDFDDEKLKFCERPTAYEIELLSWHKLAKWVVANINYLDRYVYIFDEVAKAGAGVGSAMGKAFLKITARTQDWAGFTATPGDNWMKFYPYFTACRLVRNKTSFIREFVEISTFKGYPEIVGYRNVDKLQDMWANVSYAPDASVVMDELPEQTHKVVTFKKPSDYKTILKTRTNADGEFLDTAGALCAELRRACFTKDKQEWIKDFVENVESGCVFFYNFIKTGDELAEIIEKALPEGARVWRLDGKHKEIPTADTIGPHDMVMCQWQSGSEALNLHFLSYMVIVEACYSYSMSVQGRGRIRRIGQKNPQFYYYLKTVGTIEDSIYQALRTKSDFAESSWCISQGISDETE